MSGETALPYECAACLTKLPLPLYVHKCNSGDFRRDEAKYGLPSGGDWASWQAGRQWARHYEFYGIPRWCSSPLLRGFVMGNALLAPLLVILWAVSS